VRRNIAKFVWHRSTLLNGLCALLLFAPRVQGQSFHGAAIFNDPVGPDGTARAQVGDKITVTITVMNLDDFMDTVTVTNIVDVVHHATDTLTSSNLLTAPVTLDSYLEPGTNTIEVTHTYVVLPGDENLPNSLLPNEAQAYARDNRDGPSGTHSPVPITLKFPGQISVLPSLRMVNVSLRNNLFSFSFRSQSNTTYFVETKNSLGGTNWVSSQSIPGTGQTVMVQQAASQPLNRFYRIRTP
jgi:hypothetical protein